MIIKLPMTSTHQSCPSCPSCPSCLGLCHHSHSRWQSGWDHAEDGKALKVNHASMIDDGNEQTHHSTQQLRGWKHQSIHQKQRIRCLQQALLHITMPCFMSKMRKETHSESVLVDRAIGEPQPASCHRLRISLFFPWYLMILQGPFSKGFNGKPWETSGVYPLVI